MEVYRTVDQVMMRVDVDEGLYYVEEILMEVFVAENLNGNLYYCLSRFVELEYNHLEHIEEVYDRYYQR
jgi:hypothetical protein